MSAKKRIVFLVGSLDKGERSTFVFNTARAGPAGLLSTGVLFKAGRYTGRRIS